MTGRMLTPQSRDCLPSRRNRREIPPHTHHDNLPRTRRSDSHCMGNWGRRCSRGHCRGRRRSRLDTLSQPLGRTRCFHFRCRRKNKYPLCPPTMTKIGFVWAFQKFLCSRCKRVGRPLHFCPQGANRLRLVYAFCSHRGRMRRV